MSRIPKSKVCPVCGTEFKPESARQAYCTHGCRLKAASLRSKEAMRIKRKAAKDKQDATL